MDKEKYTTKSDYEMNRWSLSGWGRMNYINIWAIVFAMMIIHFSFSWINRTHYIQVIFDYSQSFITLQISNLCSKNTMWFSFTIWMYLYCFEFKFFCNISLVFPSKKTGFLWNHSVSIDILTFEIRSRIWINHWI